ncbi:MAG: type 1 glutamine amidotransferase [Thiotrichaceae bacterium]|nr:type 1 glutamine amidotransferase [Thiotrichaceae bacterium]PCI13590.1 MAG: GMP synthase [Thiotrichales bacterium]
MKIGILQCDSVRSQFKGQYGDYPEMITSLFHPFAPTFSYEVYDVVAGHYPALLDACDVYITTGSQVSVYDDKAWIGVLQAFIIRLRKAKIKLIAICFGHQLVAQAFGGTVGKSVKGWGVGVHAMQVATVAPWMDVLPIDGVCQVLMSHQDQVLELPARAKLIAGSDFCPHAMFQLDESILTIQGHPEFSKPYAAALMGFRRELLGTPVFTAGIDSLTRRTDEQLIAQWVISFISR